MGEWWQSKFIPGIRTGPEGHCGIRPAPAEHWCICFLYLRRESCLRICEYWISGGIPRHLIPCWGRQSGIYGDSESEEVAYIHAHHQGTFNPAARKAERSAKSLSARNSCLRASICHVACRAGSTHKRSSWEQNSCSVAQTHE